MDSTPSNNILYSNAWRSPFAEKNQSDEVPIYQLETSHLWWWLSTDKSVNAFGREGWQIDLFGTPREVEDQRRKTWKRTRTNFQTKEQDAEDSPPLYPHGALLVTLIYCKDGPCTILTCEHNSFEQKVDERTRRQCVSFSFIRAWFEPGVHQLPPRR